MSLSYSDTVYRVARAAGMPAALSALIVAQARHETADFTSNVFRRCNNAFGYKAVAGAEKCTLSPENDFYKYYPSLSDSVREVVGWIRRRQQEGRFPADLATVRTPAQYAELLKNSGYYGAPVTEYRAGLTRFLLPSAKSSFPGLLVLAGLAWLLWVRRGKNATY